MSKSLRFLISSMFSTTKISHVSKRVFLIEMFYDNPFSMFFVKMKETKDRP